MLRQLGLVLPTSFVRALTLAAQRDVAVMTGHPLRAWLRGVLALLLGIADDLRIWGGWFLGGGISGAGRRGGRGGMEAAW